MQIELAFFHIFIRAQTGAHANGLTEINDGNNQQCAPPYQRQDKLQEKRSQINGFQQFILIEPDKYRNMERRVYDHHRK